ncbi:MAG: flavodoxin-dependent (E)-4-hydroxy-3-methylbut-2-enyl-diphosphate synthase [Erysipelotrichales bacterium]|nr:MAG: flavodoxin-dependent (E)-4-hydroxy-3-methylbut-2-enyl-diphosphate synthase [Erysipelotrichales bacterium]
MFNRMQTRPVMIKNLQRGGQNKVWIQSMTNTKTKDVAATVAQIKALEKAGCEIVRLAVFDEEDAYAIKEIVAQVDVPLVADIHFNYRLAIIAIQSGIHKIRLNPGNIGSAEHIKEVAEACLAYNIPIRIGINAGSLEKEILDKFGKPTPEAMLESAKRHIGILHTYGFHDIVLSFKSSDVPLTIETYRLAAQTLPYPLHLGVTEAGTLLGSAIKSSAALGALLMDGLGDTIRISVSADPVEEMKIAKQLLKCFGLYDKTPNLIACPTCGRLQYDMLPIVKEVEAYLDTLHSNVTVAVMGCAVNGPQEAKRADIGVAGGGNEALLFRKGIYVRSILQEDIVSELKKEIEDYLKTESHS